MSVASSREMVQVLAEDPALGGGLPEPHRAPARAAAIAPLIHLPRGPRELGSVDAAPEAHFGLLVLDGLIARHLTIDQVTSTELLGRGDVLRPWAALGGHPEQTQVRWEVLAPARLAVLDRDFAYRVRPWPEIASALLDRTRQRADTQLVLAAFRQARRVEDRLLLALWHFAHQWGESPPEGLVPPTANVTGEILARVVGARRQAVSTALGALADRGAVKRRGDGSLLLPHRPKLPPAVPQPEPTVLRPLRRRATDRQAA